MRDAIADARRQMIPEERRGFGDVDGRDVAQDFVELRELRAADGARVGVSLARGRELTLAAVDQFFRGEV